TSCTTGTFTYRTIALADSENGTYAGAVGTSDTPGTNATPQRIRSVQVQLTTRVAIADRKYQMSTTDGGTPTVAPGFRYCTYWKSSAPVDFARVRTVVENVELMNQARLSW